MCINLCGSLAWLGRGLSLYLNKWLPDVLICGVAKMWWTYAYVDIGGYQNGSCLASLCQPRATLAISPQLWYVPIWPNRNEIELPKQTSRCFWEPETLHRPYGTTDIDRHVRNAEDTLNMDVNLADSYRISAGIEYILPVQVQIPTHLQVAKDSTVHPRVIGTAWNSKDQQ